MFGKSLMFAAALAAAPVALACGVCIDDKVASVYDHAQVQHAFAKGQAVVFCELAGPREAAALTRQAASAAHGLRGVAPDSVRTSRDLPVLSFALDPAVQAPGAAVAELRQRLQREHVTPSLLKVMQAP